VDLVPQTHDLKQQGKFRIKKEFLFFAPATNSWWGQAVA
jgi:hypothetical protein